MAWLTISSDSSPWAFKKYWGFQWLLLTSDSDSRISAELVTHAVPWGVYLSSCKSIRTAYDRIYASRGVVAYHISRRLSIHISFFDVCFSFHAPWGLASNRSDLGNFLSWSWIQAKCSGSIQVWVQCTVSHHLQENCKWSNVGKTIIHHPFGTYLRWFGGWFIIVLPTLFWVYVHTFAKWSLQSSKTRRMWYSHLRGASHRSFTKVSRVPMWTDGEPKSWVAQVFCAHGVPGLWGEDSLKHIPYHTLHGVSLHPDIIQKGTPSFIISTYKLRKSYNIIQFHSQSLMSLMCWTACKYLRTYLSTVYIYIHKYIYYFNNSNNI